jgi:hypothetical protein
MFRFAARSYFTGIESSPAPDDFEFLGAPREHHVSVQKLWV